MHQAQRQGMFVMVIAMVAAVGLRWWQGVAMIAIVVFGPAVVVLMIGGGAHIVRRVQAVRARRARARAFPRARVVR